jgi:hypothetical protein
MGQLEPRYLLLSEVPMGLKEHSVWSRVPLKDWP